MQDPKKIISDPQPWLIIGFRIRIHFFRTRIQGLKNLSQDQNANPDPNPRTQENGDPDPWTRKMRIQCGSRSETLVLDHKDLNVSTGFRSE